MDFQEKSSFLPKLNPAPNWHSFLSIQEAEGKHSNAEKWKERKKRNQKLLGLEVEALFWSLLVWKQPEAVETIVIENGGNIENTFKFLESSKARKHMLLDTVISNDLNPAAAAAVETVEDIVTEKNQLEIIIEIALFKQHLCRKLSTSHQDSI